MSLKPLEVKTVNIATKAVTSDKIADKAIENRHIKEGAVTPDKLSIVVVSRPVNPPIDSTEIKDGAVKTDEIAGNAVTADKIAPNSITAEKILDGAVTKDKIRDGAVTKEKMADGIIGTAEIIDGAVTVSKLATNSVTKIKLASNSVGYLEIINGSVEPRHIRAIDSPANGEIPSYNQAQERFEWVAPGGGVSRPLVPPVATGEIADGAVTRPKLSYKVVEVLVPIGATWGITNPDPELVGGQILGFTAIACQDGLFVSLSLDYEGKVVMQYEFPVVNNNTFNVIVLRG